MKSKVLVYLANGIGNCLMAVPALKALNILGYEVDLAIPAEEWLRGKVLVPLFQEQEFVSKIFTTN